MNVQPSCCLDVVVYMLNCVFWRHILLEIEFKLKVVLTWAQIAIGILHSGIAHERQPNFRHRKKTRRLHRRSLRLPTRRKWAQSGYLCTTPSTAQAGADAGISWS